MLVASGLATNQIMAVIWALALAYSDLTERRIPNYLVFSAIGVCLFVLAWGGEAPLGGAPLSVAGGLGLAMLLTLPGYLTRRLGAGDVKMLLAVATMGGHALVLQTFVIGALLAVLPALAYWYFPGRLGGRVPCPTSSRCLPFGAALGGGLIGSLLLLPLVHSR